MRDLCTVNQRPGRDIGTLPESIGWRRAPVFSTAAGSAPIILVALYMLGAGQRRSRCRLIPNFVSVLNRFPAGGLRAIESILRYNIAQWERPNSNGTHVAIPFARAVHVVKRLSGRFAQSDSTARVVNDKRGACGDGISRRLIGTTLISRIRRSPALGTTNRWSLSGRHRTSNCAVLNRHFLRKGC
jgi:hypothetical protein